MDGDQRKQLESILENMKNEKGTDGNGTPPSSPPHNKSWENEKSHNDSYGKHQ